MFSPATIRLKISTFNHFLSYLFLSNILHLLAQADMSEPRMASTFSVTPALMSLIKVDMNKLMWNFFCLVLKKKNYNKISKTTIYSNENNSFFCRMTLTAVNI